MSDTQNACGGGCGCARLKQPKAGGARTGHSRELAAGYAAQCGKDICYRGHKRDGRAFEVVAAPGDFGEQVLSGLPRVSAHGALTIKQRKYLTRGERLSRTGEDGGLTRQRERVREKFAASAHAPGALL